MNFLEYCLCTFATRVKPSHPKHTRKVVGPQVVGPPSNNPVTWPSHKAKVLRKQYLTTMNLRTNNNKSTAAVLLAALVLGTSSCDGAEFGLRSPAKATATTKQAASSAAETRRVWVRYAEGNHDACVQSLQTASLGQPAGGKMKMEFDPPHTNSVVVTASEAEIQALLSDPNVVDVAEDPKRYLDTHARRKLLEWPGQATSYGIELVQANEVWEAGLTGDGVTVCVIDTGFDLTHEDFDSETFAGVTLTSSLAWTNDIQGHGELMMLLLSGWLARAFLS